MNDKKITLFTDGKSFIRNHVRLQCAGFKEFGYINSQSVDINEQMDSNDILNIHFGNSTRRLIWYILKHNLNNYVLTFHDIVPRNLLMRILLKFLNLIVIKRAKGIVFHSEFAEKLFYHNYKVTIPSCVVPVGGEIRSKSDVLRKKYNLADNCVIFIVPGIIKPSKGVKLLLEVFKELEQISLKYDFRLVLLGSFVHARYKVQINPLIGSKVIHWDRPSDEEFINAICSSNCVLSFKSFSIGETSGPIMQSFGAGVPILANSTGINPEIIPYCGDIIDSSQASIKTAIMQFINDDKYRQQLEEKTIKNRSSWTWEKMAEKYIAFFQELGFYS